MDVDEVGGERGGGGGLCLRVGPHRSRRPGGRIVPTAGDHSVELLMEPRCDEPEDIAVPHPAPVVTLVPLGDAQPTRERTKTEQYPGSGRWVPRCRCWSRCWGRGESLSRSTADLGGAGPADYCQAAIGGGLGLRVSFDISCTVIVSLKDSRMLRELLGSSGARALVQTSTCGFLCWLLFVLNVTLSAHTANSEHTSLAGRLFRLLQR